MNVDGYLGSHLSYLTMIGDNAVAGYSVDPALPAPTFVEVQKDGISGVDRLATATQVGRCWQWLPIKDRCLDMINLISYEDTD